MPSSLQVPHTRQVEPRCRWTLDVSVAGSWLRWCGHDDARLAQLSLERGELAVEARVGPRLRSDAPQQRQRVSQWHALPRHEVREHERRRPRAAHVAVYEHTPTNAQRSAVGSQISSHNGEIGSCVGVVMFVTNEPVDKVERGREHGRDLLRRDVRDGQPEVLERVREPERERRGRAQDVRDARGTQRLLVARGPVRADEEPRQHLRLVKVGSMRVSGGRCHGALPTITASQKKKKMHIYGLVVAVFEPPGHEQVAELAEARRGCRGRRRRWRSAHLCLHGCRCLRLGRGSGGGRRRGRRQLVHSRSCRFG